MYLKFFKLEEKTFYVLEKYLINLTKVYTFPYIIKFNQIRPSPYSPFHHLSCHIYQYYCYNMLLFHRVVIGHSIPFYRHSKYFFRTYFAKNIVCTTEVGHFGTRPMYSVLTPKDLLYLVDTQYNILDVLVIRNVKYIQINWYQKPMWSLRFLHYYSHHPLNYKINVINNLIDRGTALSHKKFHTENIQKIKSILLKNNYPLAFLNFIIK